MLGERATSHEQCSSLLKSDTSKAVIALRSIIEANSRGKCLYYSSDQNGP